MQVHQVLIEITMDCNDRMPSNRLRGIQWARGEDTGSVRGPRELEGKQEQPHPGFGCKQPSMLIETNIHEKAQR